MKLTFKKEQKANMCSLGVLPYTEKNGSPDEIIENVMACSVDSSEQECTVMTLQVLITEQQKTEA